MIHTYFEQGKELILKASNAQLQMMQVAKEIRYCNRYGSTSYVFETALHRIGEHSLAERFFPPPQTKECLVNRVGAYNEVLLSVLSNLNHNNRPQAKAIEHYQRSEFYIKGVGYVDPHFKEVMKPWKERKELIRQGVLERGIKGSPRFEELLAESRRVFPYEACKDGHYYQHGDRKGCSIGNISLKESLYALSSNIALGNSVHATRLISDIYRTWGGMEEGILLQEYPLSSFDATATILRGRSLLGEKNAHEDFFSLESKLMKLFEQTRIDNFLFRTEQVIAFSFALEHFQSPNLSQIKDYLFKKITAPQSEKERPEEPLLLFGWDSSVNANLCEIGLALTGLEKEQMNYYYLP